MKIANLKEIPAEKVVMDGAKDCQYQVAVSMKDGAPNFAMRIFEVAPGGHTPLHNHPYEHEIFVMDGAGTVWRDGKEVAIKPGDILYIPADEKHQFKNTVADKPFKFMCLIPAKFQKC
jgi:quercetin dioxygenase-like cupin family protein